MKDLINQLLTILKKDDVKIEIKKIFYPIIELIFYETKTYIYIALFIIAMIFIILLLILCLLIINLRIKQN
jgi:hypothetical protein